MKKTHKSFFHIHNIKMITTVCNVIQWIKNIDANNSVLAFSQLGFHHALYSCSKFWILNAEVSNKMNICINSNYIQFVHCYWTFFYISKEYQPITTFSEKMIISKPLVFFFYVVDYSTLLWADISPSWIKINCK